METNRCLYCYEELADSETDFHPACSKAFFGKPEPPLLEYTKDQMLELAEQVIQSQATVTGVQAKLSLGLQKMEEADKPHKLTIMGLWGEYILKPPTDHYPGLPELEDLTMHLADLAGIKTVPHTLIRLASGELAYLTRRIDRSGTQKFHMEDMCQLTEKLTEAKYRGSYEKIGKTIVQYSAYPVLDLINFFEVVVFSFLTGNNDMHLKNFSLFKDPDLGYRLSPAYDLVASALVVADDDEELALTLNGKKKKLTRTDFEAAMGRFQLDGKAVANIFTRCQEALPAWEAMIRKSFLGKDVKERYLELIGKNAKKLELGDEVV